MTTSNFNTADLLARLADYRPTTPPEENALQKTIDFIHTYPNFHRRSLLIGHTTASAWIIDSKRQQVLLTHHAKLDRWMQLGGHIEDDPDIVSAALREAAEESGLSSLKLATEEIYDIDIHEIPESPKAPAHLHYDIRLLLVADPAEPLKISSESKSLEWCTNQQVSNKSSEESVLRMLRKAVKQFKNSLRQTDEAPRALNPIASQLRQ